MPLAALEAGIIDSDRRSGAFLGVERSARGLRWAERLGADRANAAMAIAQAQGIPELLARVIAARGAEPETAAEHLNPTLKGLMPDPSSFRDMDAAAERFVRALRGHETIAVFGDYDVDGACSVALLRRFLIAHGHDAGVYIPDRTLEGYGPNITAFEQLISDGARLILTVDCGTAAHDPIARARELGADVIVLDHHQCGEQLPEALALINPNRLDDISAQGNLAATGVVYLFLVAVAARLRREGWYGNGVSPPDLMQWLDLVALATVCDVVPLAGFNRALVRRGLEVMRQRRNTGLRLLADTARLTSAPTVYHLGFVLGPRLNAGGRIGRAGMAADLLTTEDDALAADIAATLDRLNAERQAMQACLLEDALAQADATCAARPGTSLVVAQGEEWHKGLVGLIASGLTERFSLPALVVGWEAKDTGSGSARSIPGADIGAAIRGAVEAGILIRGGGHAMAAGFTLERKCADAFFAHVEVALREQVASASAEALLKIDGAMMASSASVELMDLMEQAGPFGAGNPQPRFAFASHRCKFAKVVGESHVRCSLTAGDGARIDAIAFRAAGTEVGQLLLNSSGMPLHVAGKLRRDQWGGKTKIELHIDDAAHPRV